MLFNSDALVPGFMVYSPGVDPETYLSPLMFILENRKIQINKTKRPTPHNITRQKQLLRVASF